MLFPVLFPCPNSATELRLGLALEAFRKCQKAEPCGTLGTSAFRKVAESRPLQADFQKGIEDFPKVNARAPFCCFRKSDGARASQRNEAVRPLGLSEVAESLPAGFRKRPESPRPRSWLSESTRKRRDRDRKSQKVAESGSQKQKVGAGATVDARSPPAS